MIYYGSDTLSVNAKINIQVLRGLILSWCYIHDYSAMLTHCSTNQGKRYNTVKLQFSEVALGDSNV